jgi:hypothetical protein
VRTDSAWETRFSMRPLERERVRVRFLLQPEGRSEGAGSFL